MADGPSAEQRSFMDGYRSDVDPRAVAAAYIVAGFRGALASAHDPAVTALRLLMSTVPGAEGLLFDRADDLHAASVAAHTAAEAERLAAVAAARAAEQRAKATGRPVLRLVPPLEAA
ncbi:MAG TPA: hypothetical protein VLE99_06255 [Candidatus Saccharimonadales bacterium]|nr:hypothetical protein [Candidatus Saccharimonadales bacterium]